MNEQGLKQYAHFKAKYPDAILLFRAGDFYETYEEDAQAAARTLGITLTRMNGDTGSYLAMFPHYALDSHLPKLVRAGFRVCICDQLEPPKK